MAPLATPTMKPRLTRRKPTTTTARTHHFKKKQKQKQKNQEISKIADISSQHSSSSSSSEVIITTDEAAASSSSSSTCCCSTPKGQKFRIPEISTCPPAPKKKKLSNNFPLPRSPISFFAPPDLELFFFLALPDDISV